MNVARGRLLVAGLTAVVGAGALLAACGGTSLNLPPTTTTTPSTDLLQSDPAAQSLAEATGLQPGDFPSGWQGVANNATSADTTVDQQFYKCLGLPFDPLRYRVGDAFSQVYASTASPIGYPKVYSEASVFTSPKYPSAILSAELGPNLLNCAAKELQSQQSTLPQGETASDFTATRLPNPLPGSNNAVAYQVQFQIYVSAAAQAAGSAVLNSSGGESINTSKYKPFTEQVYGQLMVITKGSEAVFVNIQDVGSTVPASQLATWATDINNHLNQQGG